MIILTAIVCLPGLGLAVGQQVTTSESDLSDYTAAIAHPDRARRLVALDNFVRVNSSSRLRESAVTYLIWEYLQSGDGSRAASWARRAHAAGSDNMLVLATLADAMRSSSLNKAESREMLRMANRGLMATPNLYRPLGMPAADFANLRQTSIAMLKGAAGEADLGLKDYQAARKNLRDALALRANNAADRFALGKAYLEGKDADPKLGYSYLATAVRLAQGTQRGNQMAQYARSRYTKEGGTNSGWDRYLASAQLPDQSATTAVAGAKPAPTPPQQRSTQRTETVAGTRPPVTAAKPPVAPKESSTAANAKSSIWADNTAVPPPLVRKRPRASSGPVSVGILIETSLTTNENRAALTNNLSDMVRHLGEDDEAFILGYDNNLVFEEDLTGDPHQLEEALENIKPQKGAMLDDAVAFAAGHLARIAKNRRRELLVISDGRNIDSQNSALSTSSAINAAGVTIYCLGMDAADEAGRRRLQALAANTGGRADFISSPSQMRRATIELAHNMGIDFRF